VSARDSHCGRRERHEEKTEGILFALWLCLDRDCKNFLRERATEREEGKRGGGGGRNVGVCL